jgi:hypothetical protein
MKKVLLVFAVAMFGLMMFGCASTQSADVKAAPAYTFVIQPSADSVFEVAGSEKVTIKTGETLKKALMDEYKGQATFVDGMTGPAGAIIVEPRATSIWKRGPIVKEGVATGYINNQFVAGYFGEFDGEVSAADAKTKVEGAAANWAKNVRQLVP